MSPKCLSTDGENYESPICAVLSVRVRVRPTAEDPFAAADTLLPQHQHSATSGPSFTIEEVEQMALPPSGVRVIGVNENWRQVTAPPREEEIPIHLLHPKGPRNIANDCYS